MKTGFIAVAVVALIAAGLGFEIAYSHTGRHQVTCVVTDKDRAGARRDGDTSSHYRVYTQGGPGCATFSNEDAFFAFKFNSGDIQGQLVAGHTYRMTVAGWRNQFTSTFPNIMSVDGEVTAPR